MEINRQKEINFGEDLIKEKGGKYTLASDTDDMNLHIDLYWTSPDNTIVSFDVKGLKRSARSKELNPDIEWIEFRNVQGKNGWIYGEEQYLAFEQIDYWIVFKRTDVLNFTLSRIKDLTIYGYKRDHYYLYRRTGRQDLITSVPTKDLIDNIKHIIIPKYANQQLSQSQVKKIEKFRD